MTFGLYGSMQMAKCDGRSIWSHLGAGMVLNKKIFENFTFLKKSRAKDFPFIVLYPVFEEKNWNIKYANEIWDHTALIDAINEKYSIDTGRVYASGGSAGGNCTYLWAFTDPDKFTAIAPIGGGHSSLWAKGIKETAVWVFDGAMEKRGSVINSQKMSEDLSVNNPNVKLTIMPYYGHAFPIQDRVWKWFLSFKKSDGKLIKEYPGDYLMLQLSKYLATAPLSDMIHVNIDINKDIKFKVPIDNLLPGPCKLSFEWDISANPKWKISPSTVTKKLSGKKMDTLVFTAHFKGPIENANPLPRLKHTVTRGGVLISVSDTTLPIIAREYYRTHKRVALCKKIKSPPKIDGIVDKDEWANIPIQKSFMIHRRIELTKFPTHLKLAYDDKNLYLGITCFNVVPDKFKCDAVKRDGLVWLDDSIEIFFDINPEGRLDYQFLINPNNVFADSYIRDGKWNGDITTMTAIGSNTWSAELSITWETLGFSKAPDSATRINSNFVRNNHNVTDESSQWSPTFGGNHVLDMYGIMEIE